MGYKVSAQVTRSGPRVRTDKTYKTKSAAMRYLKATKKQRPGSNPRIVKV